MYNFRTLSIPKLQLWEYMKPTLQGMDEKGVNFGVVMQPQPVNIYFFFIFVYFIFLFQGHFVSCSNASILYPKLVSIEWEKEGLGIN